MSGYYPEIVIASGETLTMSSGDIAINVRMIDDAQMYVLPGALVANAVMSGTRDYCWVHLDGGTVSCATVERDGIVDIASGGILSQFRVKSDAMSVVTVDTGVLNDAVVESGGRLTLDMFAGSANATVKAGGGLSVSLAAGTVNVSVYGNGRFGLQNNGDKAEKIAVIRYYDNKQYAAVAGADCATIIYSGKDLEIVSAADWRMSGTVMVENDASFSNIGIASGGVLGVNGGSVEGATVESGGLLLLYAYGQEGTYHTSAQNIVIQSGGQVNYNIGCNSCDSSARIGYDEIMIWNDSKYYHAGGFTYLYNVIRSGSQNPLLNITGRTEYFTNAAGGIVNVMSGTCMRHTVFEDDTDNYVAVDCSLSDTTIMQDAYVQVGSGSVLTNTYVHGGVLALASGAMLTGNTVLGGTLDLRGVARNTGLLTVALYYANPEAGFILNADNLSGNYFIDASLFSTGDFILATGVADAPLYINVDIGTTVMTLVADTLVGDTRTGSKVVGATTYTYSVADGTMQLSVGGNYGARYGNIIDGNAYLVAENCGVRSIICGAQSDVDGSIYASVGLLSSASPCNIYGGGKNVSVGGDIHLTMEGGRSTGTIYGGTLAMDRDGSAVGGAIYVDIDGLVNTNNMKVIADGETAWVVGGGMASLADMAANDVNISIENSWIGHLVGGARAYGEGAAAFAGDVSITIRNTNFGGDIYGGGYASNGGVSTVDSVSMTLDGSEGVIYVTGNIYGGGANPMHAGYGGDSTVSGDVRITLTGYGENIMVGTINGDGKIAGTVAGEKLLVMKDFSGQLFANIINFDAVEFTGGTAVRLAELSAQTLVFSNDNLSEIPTLEIADFKFEGDCELDIRLARGTNGQLIYTGDFDSFENACVNFWDEDNRFIGSAAIGETVKYDGASYSVGWNDMGLAFSYIG